MGGMNISLIPLFVGCLRAGQFCESLKYTFDLFGSQRLELLWQKSELNGASKHFMAFGGGMRFCVGTDFTKVQMAVFLHCLVTKYR